MKADQHEHPANKPYPGVVPPKDPHAVASFGFGKGTIKTIGDIIVPLPREDWGRLG